MDSIGVTSRWEGGYRCTVPVRDFEIRSDEPPNVGGDDTGPTPTELFLSSFAACFTMAVAHAARKQEIELDDISVTVTGHYRGAGFDRLTIEVSSSYPSEQLQPLVERAKSYCYVSNTLRGPPQLDYTVSGITHE